MNRSYNFDRSDQQPVFIKWFEGGKLNLSYNALDRHVDKGMGDRVAFYWEGNDLEHSSTTTYKELLDLVCQIANYLKSIGERLQQLSLGEPP